MEKADAKRRQVSLVKRNIYFIAGAFFGLMAVTGFITGLPAAETGGQIFATILLMSAMAAASVFLFKKSFRVARE